MNILKKGTDKKTGSFRRNWQSVAIAAAILVGAPSAVVAQTNGSNSPYSRYGFGILSDRAQGFNKGMAGLSTAMRNGKELNVKNPASYSAIDSMSFIFDIGFSMQNANLEQNGTKINAHNSSYDYLAMGFRASRNLGVSLGLMPFSTIGYNLSDSKPMTENPDITRTNTFSGDGGLHEVYLGVGWRPFKHISFGVNGGYVWGDVTNTVLASFSESSIASRRRQYTADLRTYKLEAGLQLMHDINKNNSLVFGLTYGLGHNINSNAVYYDQKIENKATLGDTIVARNAFALPHSFGAGLTWAYKKSLRVGVDYNWQQWSKVKSPSLIQTATTAMNYTPAKGNFTDMHKVTVGAEYIGAPEGLHWRDRVRYRLGFSYTTPYIMANGQKGPKDYLVSAGVGLPIINNRNNRSILNLAVQYERVKPQFSGMVTENYLRFSIGLTFNERWFMKWKVE